MFAEKNRILEFAKKQMLIVMTIIIAVIFSAINNKFFSIENLMNIIRQISLYGIMSCGLTFVLISGNFDLTGGAVASLACCTMVIMHEQMGPIPAMLITLAIGMVSGMVTGFFVGYVKLNNFITTLGMQSIVSAVAMMYTKSMFYYIQDGDGVWFKELGRGSIIGLPTPAYIYVALIAIFQLILSKSLFGRHVKAVGGNAVASKYAGIKDSFVIMRSYIIAGLCYALAGIILASRGLSAQVDAASGFEFDVLTACILSGTSLLGGEGSVSRAFFGVFIMGMLRNGYVMVGLPYYYQYLTQCVIIIAVVWLDIASRKKAVTR
jgi:Ribose/xylose/arabinose/galactoside ABC-type transport systems, permease components